MDLPSSLCKQFSREAQMQRLQLLIADYFVIISLYIRASACCIAEIEGGVHFVEENILHNDPNILSERSAACRSLLYDGGCRCHGPV